VARRELAVPIAARYPLGQGREALARFAGEAHVGKIVLELP